MLDFTSLGAASLNCAGGASSVALPLVSSARPKSQAILGGSVSALDAMRLQQGASTVDVGPSVLLASTGALGANLTPGLDPTAAIPRECASLVGAHIAFPASSGLGMRTPADPDDFLASKRIHIGHTAFDRQWQRVRGESLSRGTYRRVLGAVPADPDSALSSVHRWVNRQVQYTEDRDLFGTADFWAGARKTLKLRKGDCEDIALLKMQMLAAAGVRSQDMFLTIANDLVRHADHAVLIVRTPRGYRMLDNATDDVVDAAPQSDYRAILSFSGNDTWLHGAVAPAS